MADILSSLVTAGATVAGAVNSRKQREWQSQENARQQQFQASQAEKQRKYETQMYERQQADALTQWQRQNDYDSPTAQMQRFRDAGLNPNLIYGQMSQGSAAEMPSASPSDLRDTTDYRSPYVSSLGAFIESANQFNQQRLQEAQIRHLDAQTKKTGAETGKLIVETQGLSDENVRNAVRFGHEIEFNGLTIAGLKADNEIKGQQLQNLKAALDNLNAQTDAVRQSIVESNRRIQSMDEQQKQREIDNILKNKEFELKVKQVYYARQEQLQRMKISEAQFLEWSQTQALRLAGLEADVSAKQLQNSFDLQANPLRIANLSMTNDNLMYQIDNSTSKRAYWRRRGNFIDKHFNQTILDVGADILNPIKGLLSIAP